MKNEFIFRVIGIEVDTLDSENFRVTLQSEAMDMNYLDDWKNNFNKIIKLKVVD